MKEIAEERTLTETEVSTSKDDVEDHKELKELHIHSDVSNSEVQERHTNCIDMTSLSPTNTMEREATPAGDISRTCTAAATAHYVGTSPSTSKKLRFYGKGAGTFIVT